MTKHPRQAGAPDPEHKTSPILDEVDEDLPVDIDVETGVCYFNDAAYRLGDYVLSGSEMLRCEERGVWVREGEMRPD